MFNHLKSQHDDDKRDKESSVAGRAEDTTFKGGRGNKFPVLKVPRQCPFVLLLE
jgi:hypothetical protein